jgi:hypothetical protein
MSRVTRPQPRHRVEFRFAFKDVEGIDVVVVLVRRHSEARTEARVDDLKLGEFGEHTVVTRAPGDLLAITLTDSHLGHRLSISGAPPNRPDTSAGSGAFEETTFGITATASAAVAGRHPRQRRHGNDDSSQADRT